LSSTGLPGIAEIPFAAEYPYSRQNTKRGSKQLSEDRSNSIVKKFPATLAEAVVQDSTCPGY